MNERKEDYRTLENIIHSSEELNRLYNIENEQKYKLKRDSVYLQHILGELNINLSELTERTLEEEVNQWDREHLKNLVDNLNLYMNDFNDRIKIKFLIEHSIKGDLVNELIVGDNPYARYNEIVLQRLKELNVDTGKWLSHNDNVHYEITSKFTDERTIAFIQWSRDFRKEYAIGNHSECCIAINGETDKIQYKKVLLDYFLDLGIQVVHISDNKTDEEIGQAYFVPLEEKGKAILGVTSVELKNKYKKFLKKTQEESLSLVPPIINALIGEESYQKTYGFNSTLIGQRFNLFTQYLNSRKQKISQTIVHLKQKRVNLKNRMKNKKRNKQRDHIEFQEKEFTEEEKECERKRQKIVTTLNLLKGLKEQIYSPIKRVVNKLGLKEALNERTSYKGTNYLDIFKRKGYGDGFFHYQLTKKVKAYSVNENKYDQMEKMLKIASELLSN